LDEELFRRPVGVDGENVRIIADSDRLPVPVELVETRFARARSAARELGWKDARRKPDTKPQFESNCCRTSSENCAANGSTALLSTRVNCPELVQMKDHRKYVNMYSIDCRTGEESSGSSGSSGLEPGRKEKG
jgi:hypothetical protein